MGRESQATAIVRLATESGADLWHTPAGNGCITFAVNGHREHHPLASRATRDHLTRIFYFDSRTAPNATAMQAAIGTLSGIARFEGGEHDLHIRVAGHRGCIYLDLADRQWTAVEISANGWRLIREPPVRFRRTRGMLPLPVPAPGGSLAEMRPFVNVSSEGDFALVGSWLLAALRPNGPYPPLALMGEQGTAKTTTERVLRRMTDPNVADVRSEPRDARDLAVAADNGWVIAFDNLSRLPEWLSDALCRLATGGGFSTRTLYENREEEIFEAMRPVIINGITQVASRPDLIDRAIVVTLPVIEDRERRGEDDFWRAFDAARPRMLGALLDAVSCGLRRLPHVQLARKPRMADFAKWSVAVEPACPWSEGTFLLAYERNRQGAVEATLDGDPVADVVEAIAPWSGTASELLAELANRTSDNITQRRGWFSRPRQVSDTLRRLAPALRKVGIAVTFKRRGHARTRLIEIERVSASVASASSVGQDSHVGRADAGGDAHAASSADQASVFGGSDGADAADEGQRRLSGDVPNDTKGAADDDLRPF